MSPAATRDQEVSLRTAIPEVPVTQERTPFLQDDENAPLAHAGTARATIAASVDSPEGTRKGDWAKQHEHQTVLQQHIDFFDRDGDGVIWPQDTFWGFHAIGFGIILSIVAVLVIHLNFSYATLPPGHYLPDPFFRVYTARIHKDKHGSDTGTYDNEGRYIPQKFEEIFAKYAKDKDSLTFWEAIDMMHGQRVVADPFGWGAAAFEWLATYLLLWPEDGKMKKEDIRRVYDGSIFYELAARRSKEKQ